MSEYMYEEALKKGKKVFSNVPKDETSKKIKYKHQDKTISVSGRNPNYPKHFSYGKAHDKILKKHSK